MASGGDVMKALLATAVAALAITVCTGTAAAATAVSSNWSGYSISGTTFASVSGTWTQSAANCTSTTSSVAASAFWVGLGGDSETSNALEQTGTEADCTNGAATYSAWYELVPAASVKAPLTVSAGDKISATVSVDGTSVTVKLRNLTTGKSFSKTLRMASPDTSSAEWVAEAPSALIPGGARILPLTDFGTVRFTKATATSSSGHTGTISDSGWTATRISLVSGGGGPDAFGPFAAATTGTQAVPSALSTGGSAFSVTWGQTAAA
jgi:hypothetical protein